MKLDFRDFYYLDSDYVDNLSGHISGFIENEYSEVEKEEETNKGKGNVGFGVAGVDLGRDSKTGKKTSRKGVVNSEIRYKKLFDSLKELGLEQIDSFDDYLWNMIVEEGEFIEVRGSLYFTQVYDLEQQINIIGGFGSDLGFIDKKEADEVTNQISKIKELQEINGIPVKIETSDAKYKFIAYLNSKFLVKEQSDITGNDYKILCKIEKKIISGEAYELFDIKELERKTTNRAERRKKGNTLPKEFKETIVGPAAVVLPIAIYR
ncbi:hypothetical protein KFZ56_05475 [Virgibacillus sp. NKC19-3]|uniref:DUF6414 family protein n=1 Tax=Virgibacillus saliphilus TaxID=2831674 RepID=UPI001C9B0614|nr:hypothetical protein [Virgibacillus sp. NKC19-3]MBY7142537.1 hypothetical protein [Virgibacillus sp. NKC19-3]